MSIKLMKQRWLSETSEDHRKIETEGESLLVEDEGGDEKCLGNSPSQPVIDKLPTHASTDASSSGTTSNIDDVDREKEMPFFIHIDENEILCDEALIKEAKVVRCLCEPSEEDLAAGRGCGPECINREIYMECGSRCPSGNRCTNRQFQNKTYANVEAFDAGIKGWGLQAKEPIAANQFIMEYVGEVISAEEMIRRGKRYGKDPNHRHHYLMALKNGAVIDATVKGNISRFINHSCDPNCQSQKWIVNRQLRIGFFSLKPIAAGEEIVFDYQLERYGRKAQKCYCGSANCRGLIGGDVESDVESSNEINEDEETSSDGEEVEIVMPEKLVAKAMKSRIAARNRAKARAKERSKRNHQKAIETAITQGPPRNRSQVKDLVRLMIQVEQASQRCSLLQCLRLAHSDILRLFMDECGLRLLYIFLATSYPIDEIRSVLELQMQCLELLDVMPIVTKNQVIDSHIMATVTKLASQVNTLEQSVRDAVHQMIDSVCGEIASTSSPPSSPTVGVYTGEEEVLENDIAANAVKLITKWQTLREEFRIPRRERSDTPLSDDSKTEGRRGDDDESRERRRSVIPEKKVEANDWSVRIFPKSRTPPLNPTKNMIVISRVNLCKGGTPPLQVSTVAPSRRSRFDVVDPKNEEANVTTMTSGNGSLMGESPPTPKSDVVSSSKSSVNCESDEQHTDSSVIVLPTVRITGNRFDVPPPGNCPQIDCSLPPPTLLPPAIFGSGLPTFGEFPPPMSFEWSTPFPGLPPCPPIYPQPYPPYCPPQQLNTQPSPQPATSQQSEAINILSPPSPPAEPPAKKSKRGEALALDLDSDEEPTEELIEKLEKKLARMKARLALKKKLEEANFGTPPPPPPPVSNLRKLWVQATTEDGSVYFYNRETRESSWTLPEEAGGTSATVTFSGNVADTTSDHGGHDNRAIFKAQIVKYVAQILEPIRKIKFETSEDYKYVLRKLTHTILDKESKRVGGDGELKVTESVKDKTRRYVMEYITRLKDGPYNRKDKHHNTY